MTQFGTSWILHVAAVPEPPLATRPDQPPECPPETLVKVTPASEPEVFHPVVSVSNPGFPTRSCDAGFTVTVRSSLL